MARSARRVRLLPPNSSLSSNSRHPYGRISTPRIKPSAQSLPYVIPSSATWRTGKYTSGVCSVPPQGVGNRVPVTHDQSNDLGGLSVACEGVVLAPDLRQVLARQNDLRGADERGKESVERLKVHRRRCDGTQEVVELIHLVFGQRLGWRIRHSFLSNEIAPARVLNWARRRAQFAVVATRHERPPRAPPSRSRCAGVSNRRAWVINVFRRRTRPG